MGYADVSDLEARWRELTDEEAARAEALLEDASAIIDALAPPDGTCAHDPLRTAVCCNMVQRAMTSGDLGAYGVSQQSVTAGPYTQSWTLSNPGGDMYLTKMEKKLLGITGGYIGSIRAKVRRRHDTRCHG